MFLEEQEQEEREMGEGFIVPDDYLSQSEKGSDQCEQGSFENKKGNFATSDGPYIIDFEKEDIDTTYKSEFKMVLFEEIPFQISKVQEPKVEIDKKSLMKKLVFGLHG